MPSMSVHRGKSFMHQRMTENVEISNPMYLREDLDDDGDNFTLDSIAKVSCYFEKDTTIGVRISSIK